MEQEKRGPVAGSYLTVSEEPAGSGSYPLTAEHAADGFPVAVSWRALEIAHRP